MFKIIWTVIWIVYSIDTIYNILEFKLMWIYYIARFIYKRKICGGDNSNFIKKNINKSSDVFKKKLE
jgi:hypothetical protein